MAEAHDQGGRGFLVIEDDVDMGALIAEVLREHFHTSRVQVARTIGEALRLDTDQFELILCDFNLPDGTGLEAIQRILARDAEAAIIIVTGDTEIETAVSAVHAGAFDYVVKSEQFLTHIPLTVEKNLAIHRIKKENARLQVELANSVEQVQQTNRKLEELVRQFERLAMTDALTGLANRRHLNDALVRMAAAAERTGNDLSCIMIDLDGFKRLNDTQGHQRGDLLLAEVGRLIHANSRTADLAARYGGDEFAILLPNTELTTAIGVAQRLYEGFHRHLGIRAICQGASSVTLSIGAASHRFRREDRPEQLLAMADEALYAAKGGGRNRLVVRLDDGRLVAGEAAVSAA